MSGHPAEEQPRPPERFGHYELLEPLGAPNMGEVWRARDVRDGRVVAIKRLPAHLAADEDYRRRFLIEGAALMQLRHPNIVKINNVSVIEDQLALEMELVDGPDLKAFRVVVHQPTGVERAVAILRGVCAALDAAHGKDLIHRDVKSTNVLVRNTPLPDGGGADSWTGRVCLIDFGIVHDRRAGSRMTDVRQLIGSPHYMAPERFRGVADALTDVYSTGVLLHELLTGDHPFDGTWDELERQHCRSARPVTSARNDAVLPALDAVVATAMAVAPGDRYPSARALAQAASQALHADPRRTTPPPARPDRMQPPGRARPVPDPEPPDPAPSDPAPDVPDRPERAGGGTPGRGGGPQTVPVAVTARPTVHGTPRPRRPGALAAGILAALVVVVGGAWYVMSTGTPEITTVRTVPVPDAADVTLSPDGSRAYVLDADGSALHVVDLATGRVGPPIGVAPGPQQVTVSADGGRVYVDSDSAALTVVDTGTEQTSAVVGAPVLPRGLAVDAGGDHAYVTGAGPGQAVALDLAHGSSKQLDGVDRATTDVALDPDGSTAYLVSPDAGDGYGLLYVVDTSSDRVTKVVGTLPPGVDQVAVADGTVYVSAGSVFGAPGSLTAVDPDGGSGPVSVGLDPNDAPRDLVAAGRDVYVANADGSLVVVRDTSVVARSPHQAASGAGTRADVAIDEDGDRAVVSYGGALTEFSIGRSWY